MSLFIDKLFPGYEVKGAGTFRLIRDSDIEVEEEAEDLVRFYRTAIQRRRRGRVILLQLEEDFDAASEALLRQQLRLDIALVLKMGRQIDFNGLAAIIEEDRPELKFEPYSPRYPERILEHNGDCFAAIREKDIVIHHPYEASRWWSISCARRRPTPTWSRSSRLSIARASNRPSSTR